MNTEEIRAKFEANIPEPQLGQVKYCEDSEQYKPCVEIWYAFVTAGSLTEQLKGYQQAVKDMEASTLQYKNLRQCFNEMVRNVFGSNYYNMGMDVYSCDKETCEAITRTANRKWYERLIKGDKP